MFSGGRQRAGVVLGLVLAAVLALAGCGEGGSKPVSLPSISPSTSSPTPSATGSPTDLDAASAVVRRYYALLNVRTSLQQADRLAALMASGCHCQDLVRAIRDAVSKHQHFFGTNHVVSVVPNLDGLANADVLLTYDFTRSGVADDGGHVISSGPAMSGVTQDFRLVRVNQAWLITKILRVSAGKRT